MNKKIALLIALLWIQAIHAAPYTTIKGSYPEAKALMENHQFHEAIILMKNLLKTNQSNHLRLSLGDAYASVNQPNKALFYYQRVYHHATQSNNRLFQRIALFKMARMQLWIESEQPSAIKTYKQLLSMPLSKEDRTIAEAGLARAKKLQQQRAARKKKQQIEANLQQARAFLSAADGKQAYSLIKKQLGTSKDARYDMIAAESLSIMDQPSKALDYYQRAFQQSETPDEKIRALFGIAKMQFWLGQYVRAEKTYRLLLRFHLNPHDHELALAGLVKSLAYYDRPRKAYQQIPEGMVFTTQELTIAASQASSWSNWSDITDSILTTYQPITNTIPLKSSLGTDLQDLQWQTKLATSPHVITPSVFSSHDSEDFDKTRSLLSYTHYWSQLAQSAIGIDYIRYTQHLPNTLNASGVTLGQTLRPTRSLVLQGQIEPMVYKNLTFMQQDHWSFLLWDASGTYTPNDYVSLRVLGLKEVVETFPAFSHHITDNQVATSLTISPLPYIQVNGSYAKLHFSDSNNRDSYVLSSTAAILPSLGLTATGIFREYTDEFTSPYYFSPYRYKTGVLILRMGRKLGATWHYYLDAGRGRQFIVSQPGSPTAASGTYQWGLGITGPINRWLVLNAYYADVHQASAFLDSPGYHYQYGGVRLHLMF